MATLTAHRLEERRAWKFSARRADLETHYPNIAQSSRVARHRDRDGDNAWESKAGAWLRRSHRRSTALAWSSRAETIVPRAPRSRLVARKLCGEISGEMGSADERVSQIFRRGRSDGSSSHGRMGRRASRSEAFRRERVAGLARGKRGTRRAGPVTLDWPWRNPPSRELDRATVGPRSKGSRAAHSSGETAPAVWLIRSRSTKE